MRKNITRVILFILTVSVFAIFTHVYSEDEEGHHCLFDNCQISVIAQKGQEQTQNIRPDMLWMIFIGWFVYELLKFVLTKDLEYTSLSPIQRKDRLLI